MMELVVVFVLGLIIGSFLNAVIFRLQSGSSALEGRSRCPHCKHELAAKDLVPVVSFIMLAGTCRYCHKPISLQYPLVEFATAIAFVLIYTQTVPLYSGELPIRFFAYAIDAAFLVIIFVYDLRHYLILDSVVIPAAIVALLTNIFLGQQILMLVLAGIVVASFFALQFVLSNGAWIGGGDIRLGFLMGVLLSWPQVLIALFLAYILGSIIGIGLIAVGKKKMGSKVPFGTFLTVASFITLLYGNSILTWYMNLIFI